MTIMQLLTPIAEVHWLAVEDTVEDALDHLETYGLTAMPVLDAEGRYVGMVTEADLRRHVRAEHDGLADSLSKVERRSHHVAVTPDMDVDAVLELASARRFVPVVDAQGKLLGVVDRRAVDPHASLS